MNSALLKITETAVDQLGAAAGSAFAEVALFEQDNAIAAGGCIDGDANAGRAAADHGDVPGAIGAVEALELLVAIAVS
jgi:hypothetical protein